MNSARTSALAACALGLTLTQAVDPSPVQACVGRTCGAGSVLPDQGQLPENAVEVLWRRPVFYNSRTDAPTTVPTPHLYRVDGDVRTELDITTEERGGLLHVRPRQLVPAGSALVFEYDESCGFPTAPGVIGTSFQVGPAAAPPKQAGVVHTEIKQGAVTVGGATCTVSKAGKYADLTLVLSDEAKPYADGLRYQLVVDGVAVQSYGFYDGPYSKPDPIGRSILGPGKDRLFVLCGDDDDVDRPGKVAEGVHRVHFEVRLPDDSMVATDDVEIDLHCADSPRARSVETDSGDDETGAGAIEGASGDDSTPSATAETTDLSDRETSLSEDGCSVAADPRASSSLWLVLLGLIGAAWRRSARILSTSSRPGTSTC